MLQTMTFDIEATDLSAVGSGIITHVGWRSNDYTEMLRLDDYPQNLKYGYFGNQERMLLEDVHRIFSQYHIWVGHNIIKFDIPFLRSRAYRLGVPWTVAPVVYDTLPAFKRTRLLTTRNYYGQPSASLDMITDFLGLPQRKTKIYPAEHWLQIWGNEKQRLDAMYEVAEHCKSDVEMTELAAMKIWELDTRALLRRAL